MNSTILAIILVLLSSVGLGVFTGLVSFNLGSESLKGVKSLTVSNTKKTNAPESDESDLTQRKKFQFIEERTILVKVYDHIHRHRQASQKQKQASQENQD